MPKRNWLFSLLTCAGLSSLALPASGQALLPYTPQLNPEQLEQQGLELAQDAIQLVRFQQYDLALPRAKLSARLAPERYETWFILGSLYLQQEDLATAIDALQQAHSIAPEEAAVLFTLGNAHFQNDNYGEAAKAIAAGLELEPDVPSALFDLGNSYLKLDKLADAIASYQKAVAAEAKFWPAINNID